MSPRSRGGDRRGVAAIRLMSIGLAACLAVFCLMGTESAAAYGPWWVQNHMETELWSGCDGKAVSFGRVAQWSYFLVVAPQGKETRLYVMNPKTRNYAYIDARAVGPSGPPPREAGGAGSAAPVSQARTQAGESTSSFAAWWGETQVAAELWSGADGGAVSFGRVGRGSALLVVAPQRGARYYVFNPASKNYAYVDAGALVPGSPPVEGAGATVAREVAGGARKPPKLANGYEGWWVSNFRETELWAEAGQEANTLGRIPQFRRFLVVEPQEGDRLKVWYPEKDVLGYLDAKVVGPSSESVWVAAHPVREGRQVELPGRSVGEKTYLRSLPVADDETELRRLPNNTALTVKKSVVAADGAEWYVVGEGEYVLASQVRVPRQPVATHPGRWIDADLDEPAMVTAYEGDRVVRTTLAIKGVRGFPTPEGEFRILRRVQSETMDSETIGIPREGAGGYLLKNVLYTQYFTNDGASLHYNYWLGTFGYPGSHGCLGLSLEDSRWLWDWADVGTPVIVRSNGGTEMVQAGAAGGSRRSSSTAAL